MRDYASTAQAQAGASFARFDCTTVVHAAAAQVTLATLRRYAGRPLLFAYLNGFGDVA